MPLAAARLCGVAGVGGDGHPALAVAGALAQFVFIGLLGLILLPAGFLLAASALMTGRASAEPSDPAMGSITAAWVGVILVAVLAFQGGSLAFALIGNAVE